MKRTCAFLCVFLSVLLAAGGAMASILGDAAHMATQAGSSPTRAPLRDAAVTSPGKGGLTLSAPGVLASGRSTDLDAFYIREALALTQLMGELAASPAFVQAMTMEEEINARAAKIAEIDFSQPLNCHVTIMPVDAVIDHIYAESSLSPIPDAVYVHLQRRAASSILALMNDQIDAYDLALSSLLTTSKTFLIPQEFMDNTLVLLHYDNVYGVVIFQQTGDETLTAQAAFLLTERDPLINLANSILPLRLNDTAYSQAELETLVAN